MYTEHYDNLAEREQLIAEAQVNGFRMVHDDFDASYDFQGEPHGTLTFDSPAPPTAEELAEALADQRLAELRALLKLGASVIVSAPTTGEYRVISVERNPEGKMNAKYKDEPE